jgi:hypothetical protein
MQEDNAGRREDMAERVLRGSRLGAVSYETDSGIELALRSTTTYDCPEGHVTVVPFSDEADIPAIWECRTCGANARRRDGDQPAAKAVKPPRTHWDMLLERRSEADLEEVLNERLALLRASRGEKTRPRKSA